MPAGCSLGGSARGRAGRACRYQHYEKVENGDLNEILPGKFIAFSGPSATRLEIGDGLYTLAPEDYHSIFRKKGITAIVRLNKKVATVASAGPHIGGCVGVACVRAFMRSVGCSAWRRPARRWCDSQVYDRRQFTCAGFKHYDMYFMDGGTPTEAILRRFMEAPLDPNHTQHARPHAAHSCRASSS